MLELICKEIGVELGEIWEADWNRYELPNLAKYTKFKITKNGVYGYNEYYGNWYLSDSFLTNIVLGNLQPRKDRGLYSGNHIQVVDSQDKNEFESKANNLLQSGYELSSTNCSDKGFRAILIRKF